MIPRYARFLLPLLLAFMPTPAQSDDCSQSLQSLIDAAPAGSTLSVPACVYRESVTVSKPLTIDGQNAAEIRGSEVWSDWTQNGNVWTSTLTVPDLPFYPDVTRCADGTDRCLRPEQVFVDGQPATFSLDGARHVVLSQNPVGHGVEVTTRPIWLRAAANGVTVKNMTMRHAGSDAQQGAIANGSGSDFVLDNDHLLYAHGYAVRLCCGAQTGLKITNSEIAYAGEMGIGAYQVPGLILSGNHIHDNNLAGYNCDWECGGTKLVSVPNAQVTGNEVDHNPVGIWFDIGATNALVQGNNVHDSSVNGIVFEISNGATIQNNAVWNNGYGRAVWGWGAGILIQTSGGASVSNNTLAWNYAGVSVIQITRGDAPASLDGNSVHDNTVVRQIGDTSNFWGNQQVFANDDQAGALTRLHPTKFANNAFWMDRGEGYPPELYTYANVAWWRLQDWAAGTGDTSSRYLSNAEAIASLTAAGIPSGAIAKPATPTATPLPTFTPTPRPTSTSTPRPTSTPIRCAVEVYLNGVSQGRKPC